MTSENEKNKTEKGALYLVATPIGNLDDITLRALKVLRECDFIAAEDTRVTAKLLSHFEISKPTVIYQKYNVVKAGGEIADRLAGGETCALVTDAG
ncbi:MAG: 16S rRNA (cytidine(1402)-2'-O)-methyltransferase, partial [Clostridia bacterium]|nr:16S rRNA (cytidine(1402)-2'-O)-methyltransferase [Clostridia bacterium]